MTKPDALVRRYLRRLDRALAGVPAEQRRDIAEHIAEHIRSSRAELPAGGTEEDVRAILDRLGDPAAIAARAREEAGLQPAAPAPWGVREVAAVLLLTLGAVLLPVLAPLAGLVLAAGSRRWSGRQKLTAVAVPLAALVAVSLTVLLVQRYWPIDVAFLAVALVPIGAGIMLAVPPAAGSLPTAARVAGVSLALLLAVLLATIDVGPAELWGIPLLILAIVVGAARLGLGGPPRRHPTAVG